MKSKYVINKIAFLIILLLVFLSTVCWVYLDNSNDYKDSVTALKSSDNQSNIYSEENDKKYSKKNDKRIWIKTFRDCLVILSSTLGVSLLINIIITKRSMNDICDDIIVNDLFASKHFLEKLNSNSKEKVIAYLDSVDYKVYPQNNDYIDMLKCIREKSKNLSSEIYYNKLVINIHCTVYDDYIEKKITRQMDLRSFKENCKINEFKIDAHSCEMIGNKDSYEIKSLKLLSSNEPNKNLKDKIKSIPVTITDREAEKSKYNRKVENYLNYHLNINSNKDTTIEYTYFTRVPIHDKSYTCRLFLPAKAFEFSFTIDGNDKHYIFSQAFGFKSDAKNSPSFPNNNTIHYAFDEWLLERDGVAVSFE